MKYSNPFFNPFLEFQCNEQYNNYYEKIINKIDQLEKNIQILETKINKLVDKDNKENIPDEPADMYMI